MPDNVQRSVANNVVYSREAPAMQIAVDPAFTFVGELQFILKEVAWVHIFYFVEADGPHIRRTFHVQFEGFLPSNTHTYRYVSPQTYTLGHHDYLYDVQVGDYYHYILEHPDTDAAKGYALYAAKGYDISGMTNIIRERYVRILDKEERNEILFIYAEDLTPSGLTEREWNVQDLRFEQIQVDLHIRAQQTFQVIEG